MAKLDRIAKKQDREPSIIKEFTVRSVKEKFGKESPKTIFSFQFFDRTEHCFNLGGAHVVCDNWFVSLLDTVKELSEITWVEARQKGHYNIHPHDWEKANFKYKIFDDDTLNQLDCCQFSLGQGKGRVHGFKIDNVFYIYWLDPNHNMYDMDGHEPHHAYKYKPLPNCLDVLMHDNISLARDNKRQEIEIEQWVAELEKHEGSKSKNA